MLTLLFATQASVTQAPAPDPCDGSHWEALSLPVLVECVYSPNGDEAAQRVWRRYSEIFESEPPPSAGEEAALLLAWSDIVEGFERGPLESAVIGATIEGRNAARLASLWTVLTPRERQQVSRGAASLARSGIPDLTAQRVVVEHRVTETWTLEPWTSWCVASVAEATRSVQPLLYLPDAERAEALQTWTDGRPRNSVWPWRATGESCTAGIGPTLQGWHIARLDANRTWRDLATRDANAF